MDTAQLDKSLVDLWPLGPVSSYSINTETYIDEERWGEDSNNCDWIFYMVLL